MSIHKQLRKLSLAMALAVLSAGIGLPQALAADNASEVVQVAPVSINTADAETLAAAIQGVGMSRAEAIVQYREQNGPFKSVDELANVRGIGERTLEKNRSRITL